MAPVEVDCAKRAGDAGEAGRFRFRKAEALCLGIAIGVGVGIAIEFDADSAPPGIDRSGDLSNATDLAIYPTFWSLERDTS
jgi:hypothetical protein